MGDTAVLDITDILERHSCKDLTGFINDILTAQEDLGITEEEFRAKIDKYDLKHFREIYPEQFGLYIEILADIRRSRGKWKIPENSPRY